MFSLGENNIADFNPDVIADAWLNSNPGRWIFRCTKGGVPALAGTTGNVDFYLASQAAARIKGVSDDISAIGARRGRVVGHGWGECAGSAAGTRKVIAVRIIVADPFDLNKGGCFLVFMAGSGCGCLCLPKYSTLAH